MGLAELLPLSDVVRAAALVVPVGGPCSPQTRRNSGRGAGVPIETMLMNLSRLNLDQIPVPLSATDVAEAPPPGATFKLADFRPVEVGLNVTLTKQLPPTAT